MAFLLQTNFMSQSIDLSSSLTSSLSSKRVNTLSGERCPYFEFDQSAPERFCSCNQNQLQMHPRKKFKDSAENGSAVTEESVCVSASAAHAIVIDQSACNASSNAMVVSCSQGTSNRHSSDFLSMVECPGLGCHFGDFLAPSWVFVLDYLSKRSRRIALKFKQRCYVSKRLLDASVKFNSITNQAFWNGVRELEAIVTGSFVLQLLNADNWNCSDVDVMKRIDNRSIPTTEDAYRKLFDSFFQPIANGHSVTSEWPNDRDAFRCSAAASDYFKNTNVQWRMCALIEGVPSDRENGRKFLKFDAVFSTVLEAVDLPKDFDIPFVKNSFDGRRLLVRHPLSVWTKQCAAHELTSIESGRIIKYKHRGYSINGLMPMRLLGTGFGFVLRN
jgi:hypothetical protein